MTSWPLAFTLTAVITALAAAVTLVTIYSPPEPESPKVVCIKEHGQWTDGYGRAGWSGTCVFPKEEHK